MSACDCRAATVLVVEDDHSNAQIVRRWLESDGYTVVLAETGAEALEAVRAHKPDIVLLDIVIPAPSGFHVCAQLKRDPATHHIPILLMSGLQEPANWLRGRELGAVEFLAKPLDVERVSECVRKYLGHPGARERRCRDRWRDERPAGAQVRSVRLQPHLADAGAGKPCVGSRWDRKRQIRERRAT